MAEPSMKTPRHLLALPDSNSPKQVPRGFGFTEFPDYESVVEDRTSAYKVGHGTVLGHDVWLISKALWPTWSEAGGLHTWNASPVIGKLATIGASIGSTEGPDRAVLDASLFAGGVGLLETYGSGLDTSLPDWASPRYEALKVNLSRSEDDQELKESLETLEHVLAKADEYGYPRPNRLALKNARDALEKMYAIHPGKYDAWPTEDGDVGLSVPVLKMGHAITVECDADGGLQCMVNIGDHMCRMKDYTAELAWTTSDFIPNVLKELSK